MCGKSFAHVSNLRVHERGHAGDRPHACSFPSCTKAFRHTSSRDDHFVAVHQGLRQYVCDLCARDFTAASNLKRHQKTCVPQHAAAAQAAAAQAQAQILAHAVAGSDGAGGAGAGAGAGDGAGGGGGGGGLGLTASDSVIAGMANLSRSYDGADAM
jgi:hypothetical protein